MLYIAYLGFTLPQIDEVLAPYAEKSYQKYLKKYLDKGLSQKDSEDSAYEDVVYEMKQGYQGWEYKFNTVASSRGDYPFNDNEGKKPSRNTERIAETQDRGGKRQTCRGDKQTAQRLRSSERDDEAFWRKKPDDAQEEKKEKIKISTAKNG